LLLTERLLEAERERERERGGESERDENEKIRTVSNVLECFLLPVQEIFTLTVSPGISWEGTFALKIGMT
jgi:hypothetical protein